MMGRTETTKAKTRQPASAVQVISAAERERFVSILDFWHKIEFFIPFDLDQRIAEEDEHKIRFLHRRDLDNGSAELWHAAVEDGEEIKMFVLYLGVFDKSEITRVCDRVLGATSSVDDDGDFERTELEGRTCFAQLTVDRTGQLVLEPARSGPVSYVSTLPWALGQFEKGGLAS